MSLVHLHLLLNHVPVVGTLFLLALFGAAFIRRDVTLARTALWTCVVIAAVTAAVFLTGEPAEEAVEGMAGISESALERHEDVALVALIAMIVAGLASAAALLAIRARAIGSRPVAASGLAMSLVLAGIMAVTANLGGQVRHAEIRGDAPIRADTGAPVDTDDAHDR